MGLFHNHHWTVKGYYRYCECGKTEEVKSPFLNGYETRTPYKEPEPTPEEVERVKKQQAHSNAYHEALLEVSEINFRNASNGNPTHYTPEDLLNKRGIKHYEKPAPTPPPPLVTPTQVAKALSDQEKADEAKKFAQERSDYMNWLNNAGG